MVLSRLRSSTARTSSSLIVIASFGSGLPPLAAMSPPALWTRISIGPSSRLAVSTTRAMSPPSVRSPSTRMVRTPWVAATSSATAVSVDPSPYSAGPFSRMPWIATSAPMPASFSAKARPSPRPAPVTNATLPLSARAPSCDAMMSSPGCENVSRRRSVTEGLDAVASSEHECIGNMNQRREIEVGGTARDQLDEMSINAEVFVTRLVQQRPVVMDEASATVGNRQAPGIGFDVHLAGLRSGLAPVKTGPDPNSGVVGECQVGCDRRMAICREGEIGFGEKKRPGQNAGDEGERIDTGIENAKSARLPDPGLARMPGPHVFLPNDVNRLDLTIGEK